MQMIEIRADAVEVDVSGTEEELREIGFTIVALTRSAERSVVLPALDIDPSPYPRALTGMIVERSTGKTFISVAGSELTVRGSDSSLVAFASWFDFPPGAHDGYHQHFEPQEDDHDHSSESAPLIISVHRAGA